MGDEVATETDQGAKISDGRVHSPKWASISHPLHPRLGNMAEGGGGGEMTVRTRGQGGLLQSSEFWTR